MAYLLDANVFISAKNQHYGFDFCPAFWEWLLEANQVGRVFSIQRVRDELSVRDDELTEWARNRGGNVFLPPEASLVPALAEVSSWATGQGYDQAAINTFFQVADYYLVAQALAGEHTVVTHERPSGSTRKIKIPDACTGIGIRLATPYEMLRREGARFVLGA